MTCRWKQEVSRARVAIMQAALDSLEGDGSEAVGGRPRAIRGRARGRRPIRTIRRRRRSSTSCRLRAIKRQREKLDRLREEGVIGDEAYHRIEEEIDWAELDASPAGRFQPLTT